MSSPVRHSVCLVVAFMAAACAFAAPQVRFTAADATNAYSYAAGLVKAHTPRHAGTPGALAAAKWIHTRAVRSGLSARIDRFRARSPDGEWEFANVIGEMKGMDGPDAPWIVFISHFDTYRNAGAGFEGANDSASTTGILLALALSIYRSRTPRRNLAFIWTDGEEAKYTYGPNDGFQGSNRAVAEFKRLGRKVCAAVNLDMLGDRDLHIELPANATPELNNMVLKAAKDVGLESYVSIGKYAVSDDYSAFLDAGWPATDLIDFSFGPNNRWWHVPDDTMDKVSVDSLYVSGRIAAALFNILDDR